MVSTYQEIRDQILDTANQEESQVGDLVKDLINITLREIESPGWAYAPRRESSHNWTWLRRKTDFTTVSGTEDYVLERDIKKIALIRQEESPLKLSRMTDDLFHEKVPNPTASGNPTIYRTWELSGVATKIAEADTIDVVSSSADDDDDSDLNVTVWGYVGGILQSEVYTLNGTTAVAGTTTFDGYRDLFTSKSKNTAGTITITENSGGTTLVTLGKEERAPLFKAITLYPNPSSAITMYVEYYTHLRELVNLSDVPQFDQNWHYVVRLGALAKLYQHLGKETDFTTAHALYASAVRSWIDADSGISDYIPKLKRHDRITRTRYGVRRSTDDITA